jgi:hypothetical protein
MPPLPLISGPGRGHGTVAFLLAVFGTFNAGNQ